MVSAKDSQTGGADRRLQELGIQLPAPSTPFGTYVEAVQTGNLLFFSGMLPVVDHKPKYVGRPGIGRSKSTFKLTNNSQEELWQLEQSHPQQ
jgi:enamine deaminase RidA (YjgF/YER057c/UK114 family)